MDRSKREGSQKAKSWMLRIPSISILDGEVDARIADQRVWMRLAIWSSPVSGSGHRLVETFHQS